MPFVDNAHVIIRNPEFDPRIQGVHTIDDKGNFGPGSKLYRGRIESADRAGAGGFIYRLQFLYNPTSFTHTANMDSSIQPAIQQDSNLSLGDASQFLQMSQTVGFSLLFDRTYETWGGGNVRGDAHEWGVLADIKYLYAMLGMFDSTSTKDSSGNFTLSRSTLRPEEVLQSTPSSVLQYRPVWLVFGPKTSFYGYISTIAVTYTHFTQSMIPNRCAVDLNVQLIPKVSDASAAANSVRGNAAAKARTNIGQAQRNRLDREMQRSGSDYTGPVYTPPITATDFGVAPSI